MPRTVFFDKGMDLGAHRGGAGLWPENTLYAFERALERWPDVLIECDTRITADGQAVVIHDATVDRTTNGSGAVREHTLDALRELDAGCRFATEDGSHPFANQGIGLSTLLESLEALPGARLLVEMKDDEGIADATCGAITAAGAEDRVLLASFEPKHMARAKELVPGVPSCFNSDTGKNLWNHLTNGTIESYAPENDVLALDIAMIEEFGIKQEWLPLIHSRGILVQVHTINERAKMEELLDWGIDCILSDRPDILAEVLEAKM